jgi:hypothetical protein
MKNSDLKKTGQLNEEELLSYFSEHVLYEIKQLINATYAINKRLPIHNGLQNTVVKSFAIHLRNLITFLYPFNRQEDDVCAEDFFCEAMTWENLRCKKSDTLQNAKKRADKEVGHLTTARQFGTPKSKEWDVVTLTEEVMPIIKLFCESSDRVGLQELFIPVWNMYLLNKKSWESGSEKGDSHHSF